MARIFLERRDMDDDVRGLFEGLVDDAVGAGAAGECTPPLDVVETGAGLEVIMDLAGVSVDSLKVLITRNTLVIAGQKRPAACRHHAAAFHLVERAFGRFARGVRLTAAFDAGRTDATLRDGELRITLPRIEERRGREIHISVRTD